MSLQVTQLPFPLATIPLPRAADLQAQHFPLFFSVQHRVERLLAERTWLTECLDATDTRLADVGTAAAKQVGIAEWQEADGTVEGVWRGINEIAVVSSSSSHDKNLSTPSSPDSHALIARRVGPGSHTTFGIWVVRRPKLMLHNTANRKLIDPEQWRSQSPGSACVGLPAEVVSDAIIGAFQQLAYSNPTASQKRSDLGVCEGTRRLRFSSNRRG